MSIKCAFIHSRIVHVKLNFFLEIWGVVSYKDEVTPFNKPFLYGKVLITESTGFFLR